MGIKLPGECPRGLNNCTAMSQIKSDSGESFWCCGENDGEGREEITDIYTVCFKNSDVDEIGYWNLRDISESISVKAQALSVIHNLRSNGTYSFYEQNKNIAKDSDG